METVIVAKHLINMSYGKGIYDISPNKLQKLVYLVYKEVAIKYKEPLFQEKFVVSREGFILKSIKEYYKTLGEHEYIEVPGRYGLGDLDQKTKDILIQVLDNYGHIPVYNLLNYIHGSSLWYYCMSKGIKTIDYKNIIRGY